jgi:hypothetical protein
MEQSIHFGARGHANASLAKRGKRLVGRVAACVWKGCATGRAARSRPYRRADRIRPPFRWSVALVWPCFGLHLNGYLSLPVSVCDWTALLGK